MEPILAFFKPRFQMKIFLAVISIIVATIIFLALQCDSNSHIRVWVRSLAYPPLRLTFETSRIKDKVGIDYYSETAKEYLWVLQVPRAQLRDVIYGELPPGSTQRTPRHGKPRPLKVGEKIVVSVGYDYDRLMAACTSSRAWRIEIESETKAKILGDASDVRLPPPINVCLSKVEFPPLKFFLKNMDAESLGGIGVYSKTSNEWLWNIEIDKSMLKEIGYGVVPSNSKQTIPHKGAPRSFKAGEEILVQIRFDYEVSPYFPKFNGQSVWRLEVESEEMIRLVGEVDVDLPSRQKPKE
jgi:hypothetical protein